MKIIIVGGGLVGASLAFKLASDGNNIVLVEKDRELTRELDEHLDVQVTIGDGCTLPVLKKAGIAECDLLLATTNSDEANMVVALMGSAVFDVPRVVARLRDEGHEESFHTISEEIGRDHLAINPDHAAVERILALIRVPGAIDVAPFFSGRVLIAGFLIRKESAFNGLLLSHLRLLFPQVPMLVVAIRRGGNWKIPHGEDEMVENDLVYFAMDPSEVSTVSTLMGFQPGKERRIMIAGATRIGIKLARSLENSGYRLTLLDGKRQACELAAAELEKTMVIHSVPTNREALIEEGAERADAFIACTDDHETNVVACLLARQLGARHTMAFVDNPALAALIGDIGIDALISPRLLAVGLALQFARKGKVRAVAALLDDAVEVLDVEAGAGSRLLEKKLKDMGLPRGVLVAAILREDRILLPKGEDRIEAADRVLFVTTADTAARLDDFLGA